MTTAAVSVVIPCYRCAATLQRAVASVAAQTLQPQELILVDDASGDKTQQILRDIQNQWDSERLRLIVLARNIGAGSARNIGWDGAQGEYVAFLDADDAWHPKKIELQYALMQAHPQAALSAHAASYADRLDPDTPVDATTYRPISLSELLVSNRFVTPSVMVRKNIRHRFRQGQRHMEDHLLWMEMAGDGLMLLKMDAVLVNIFKPAFGASGLSAELWKMEQAELGNYRILREGKRIGLLSSIALQGLSWLKFARRLLILGLRG